MESVNEERPESIQTLIRKWNQKATPDDGLNFEDDMTHGRTDTYARKRFQRFKVWLNKSRWSGVLFGGIYGVIMFLYLTFMVLSEPEYETDITLRKQFNFSRTCKKKSEDVIFKNKTGNSSSANTGNLLDENSNYMYSVTIGFSVFNFLTVLSVFSRRLRCIMVLILPGTITGRGRAILVAATFTMLVEGPINSISYNMMQVVESHTCMYEATKSTSCLMQDVMAQTTEIISDRRDEFQRQLRQIEKNIERATGETRRVLEEQQRNLNEKVDAIQNKLENARDAISAITSPCKAVKSFISGSSDFFNPFTEHEFPSRRKRRSTDSCPGISPFPKNIIDTDLDSMEELKAWVEDLSSDQLPPHPTLDEMQKLFPDIPNISGIREEILTAISSVFGVVKLYIAALKRVVSAVSLLLLIYMSNEYFTNYYSDDSFDNMFIDDNIRILWHSNVEQYPKLTPLRNWEKNKGYRVSTSPKISKKEWKSILVKMIPTSTGLLITVIILFIDYGLAKSLSGLTSHGKYAISFKGMEDGKTLEEVFPKSFFNYSSLEVEKIDLSTEPCLPRPMFTKPGKFVSLSVLFVVMMVSGIFDVYCSRVRASICNVFYRDCAKERGVYLYNDLRDGRSRRRIRLNMIVTREFIKRIRIDKFNELFFRNKICNFFKGLCIVKGISQLLPSNCIQKKIVCLSCNWTAKTEDMTKEIHIKVMGTKKKVRICKDCAKDMN